jgi:hypothetical protein
MYLSEEDVRYNACGYFLGGVEERLEKIEQNFNTLSLLIMSPFKLSTSGGRALAPD